MPTLRGRAVVPGRASGPVCRLTKPISLWGGVEPTTGKIIDPRHPDHGRDITGTVLVLPSTIGSSSSSAIMLELLRHQHAPAGVALGHVDAILTLGVIVAREMGYPSLPIVALDPEDVMTVPHTGTATIMEDGRVVFAES
jgi:predicted aconitase with swiveling domain